MRECLSRKKRDCAFQDAGVQALQLVSAFRLQSGMAVLSGGLHLLSASGSLLRSFDSRLIHSGTRLISRGARLSTRIATTMTASGAATDFELKVVDGRFSGIEVFAESQRTPRVRLRAVASMLACKSRTLFILRQADRQTVHAPIFHRWAAP